MTGVVYHLASLVSAEGWRPVPGWEGLYDVSDLGRVRSHDRQVPGRWPGSTRLARGKVLSPRVSKKTGYLGVCLYRPDVLGYWSVEVHVLVALAFIGPRPTPDHEVRHLDGDPMRCAAANLAYGTGSENQLDKVRHGRCAQRQRAACPRGHRLVEPNLVQGKYAETGWRECRACDQARTHVGRHSGVDFAKEADRRYRLLFDGWQPAVRPPKLLCTRGHRRVPPNLEKDGKCRACVRARQWVRAHPDACLADEADRRYSQIMGEERAGTA